MRAVIVLLVFAAVASAVPLVIPPPCKAGSLANFITLGNTGCSFPSAEPVAAFNYGFAAGGGGPLKSSDIFIDPSAGESEARQDFSANFAAGPGDHFTYLIVYEIDPRPPVIQGMALRLNTFTPKNGGTATVTTELCVGAAFSSPLLNNSCKGTLLTLTTFFDSSTVVPTFDLFDSVRFASVSDLGVRNTVVLDGGAKGSSTIAGFSNGVILPEPSTFVAGAGLLLLLIRSRLRARGTLPER
jgi:hypothetical protein